MKRSTLDGWIAERLGGETFSRAALEAYQLASLNQTLSLARESGRFYAKRLPSAGVSSLRELKALPFTFPSDLAEAPEKFLCVHPSQVCRIVTLPTSGTTGKPKRLFFSEEDIELCLDFFENGMKNLVTAGDFVGVLFPAVRRYSVGDLLIQALLAIGCRAECFSAENAAEYTSLAGEPSAVLALAEKLPQHRPRTVLLSADYVSETCRRSLETRWHCEIFEHYGMTEMGLGCAVSCGAHEGYHWREADFLLEIVDPQSGEALPEGETGEIVFTTLTRNAMPLIRYRTGDISRILTEPCPCGSSLKRLARVGERRSL